MNSEEGNARPPSVLYSSVDSSASTADPATVTYQSPSFPLLLTNVEGNLGLTVIPPLAPAQVPVSTKFRHLHCKCRHDKRAHQPLCPLLVSPAVQGRPCTPTLHHLTHRQPYARRGHFLAASHQPLNSVQPSATILRTSSSRTAKDATTKADI